MPASSLGVLRHPRELIYERSLSWCKNKSIVMLYCVGKKGQLTDFWQAPYSISVLSHLSVGRKCTNGSLGSALSHVFHQPKATITLLIDMAQLVKSTMCWIYNLCCKLVVRAAVNLSIFIIYVIEASLCVPLRAALWPQWFLQLLSGTNTSQLCAPLDRSTVIITVYIQFLWFHFRHSNDRPVKQLVTNESVIWVLIRFHMV